MQFIKTREVKNPIRNPEENAGIDFFIPECNTELVESLDAKNNGTNGVFANGSYLLDGVIYIAPGKDVIIPSGIRSKFAKNLALIANNKSGVATKKKLIFGASVIDTSYQGEWHFHLFNLSEEYQTVACGEKVIQFIPHVISMDEIEILDLTPEEFYTEKTSRGDGWQGSTGIQ
jgi:dUTPase